MKKVVALLMLFAIASLSFAPAADAAGRRYVRRGSTHADALRGNPTPLHPKAAYYPNSADNYLPHMR
jgi:hypothetical protein